MLLAVVALSTQCPASVQFTSPAPNVSISDIAQWAQKLLMMVKLDLDGVWRLVASCRQSPYLTWRHHYQQPHTLMVQCLCHSQTKIIWDWKLISPCPKACLSIFSRQTVKCEVWVCGLCQSYPWLSHHQRSTAAAQPWSWPRAARLITDQWSHNPGFGDTSTPRTRTIRSSAAAELCPSVLWLSDASTPPPAPAWPPRTKL